MGLAMMEGDFRDIRMQQDRLKVKAGKIRKQTFLTQRVLNGDLPPETLDPAAAPRSSRSSRGGRGGGGARGGAGLAPVNASLAKYRTMSKHRIAGSSTAGSAIKLNPEETARIAERLATAGGTRPPPSSSALSSLNEVGRGAEGARPPQEPGSRWL